LSGMEGSGIFIIRCHWPIAQPFIPRDVPVGEAERRRDEAAGARATFMSA
jgi:hypothetical protein